MTTQIQVADGKSSSLCTKIYNAKSGVILSAENIENISKTLKLIFVIVGLAERNYPEQLEFDYLKLKVQEYFKELTCQELILAFELAVQQKYEIDLKLYDKPFSLNYINDVITTYKKYKFDILKKEKMKQKELFENQHPPKDIQEIRLKEGTLCYWRLYRDNYIKDFSDYGNAMYNYLDRIGVIPFTKERKSEIKKQAIEKYRTELINNSINISKPHQIRDDCKKILSNFDNLKEENRIISISKVMALQMFFDELKEVGEDLETIIKENNT